MRLIYESIKALEIKTSMVLNLVFAKYTILSCFSWLILLIPSVIAQIFNPTAELPIPTGIPTKEAKAEMETHKNHRS